MQSTTLNHLPPYYISAWGKALHKDQLILGWTGGLSCLWWNNSHPAVSEASCLVWSGPSFKLASVTTNHSLKKTRHSSCPGAWWLSSSQRLIGKYEEQRTGFVFSHHWTQFHLIMYIYSALLSLLWCLMGFQCSCCDFLRHSNECCFLYFFIFLFYAVRLL